MPLLPAQSRKTILTEYMQEASATREPLKLSKPDLQSAINATDAELYRQIASLDSTLPLQAQTGLSRAAKNALYRAVSRERWKAL